MRSFPKINVFLKICGKNAEGYHLLVSRFLLVDNIYDEMECKKKLRKNDDFEIRGNFSCEPEKNTIFKAYKALLNASGSKELEQYFKEHSIEVHKSIPEGSGLGGGSSNAGVFLNMCNELFSLGISTEKLALIGKEVGADVPFFVYGYKSANVSGIGEVVERFDEEPLDVELIFPDIACDTKSVYKAFSERHYKEIGSEEQRRLMRLDSKSILKTYDANYLNDLYASALDLYPNLKAYGKDAFFSGSGSTFFRIKDVG